MTIKFFTTPPSEISWPYVMINAYKPKVEYIRQHRSEIEEVIIDSGIEIFRDANVQDYPNGHLGRLVNLYGRVCSLVSVPVWVTVPDYCDDYHPRALWIDEKRTNIERTHDNIVQALKRFPDVHWLIPIQGHNENLESIGRAIHFLEKDGVLDGHQYFAVANLCTTKHPAFTRECLKFTKMMLPSKKLHAFGIDVRSIRITDFADVLYSFDSLAWTFPHPGGRGRASCSNKQERVQYFHDFIERFHLEHAVGN